MTEINQLKKKNQSLTMKYNECNLKINEYSREMRETKARAKEREDVYVLNALEEKERLTQRIVRLQLELEAKTKELSNTDAKSKVMDEIAKNFVGFKESILPIVEVSSLAQVNHQIRIIMIKTKQTQKELKNILFNDYKGDEKISIKELIKIFQKKPLNLSSVPAENLSRYLIEPRENLEIVFSKYTEKSAADIRIRLDYFLDIDYPKDFYENLDDIKKSAGNKIKPKFNEAKQKIRNIISEVGEFNSVNWVKICKDLYPDLNTIERDCLMSIMIDDINDIDNLKFTVIIFNIIEFKSTCC